MLPSSCVSFLAGCGQENLHGVASGGHTTSAGYLPSELHPAQVKAATHVGSWALGSQGTPDGDGPRAGGRSDKQAQKIKF